MLITVHHAKIMNNDSEMVVDVDRTRMDIERLYLVANGE